MASGSWPKASQRMTSGQRVLVCGSFQRSAGGLGGDQRCHQRYPRPRASTIHALTANGARVILAAHFRPAKGQVNEGDAA